MAKPTLVAAERRGVAGDGGVDPDDLTAGVDERATRVARGDGRVGLDETVEERSLGSDRPVDGRHDAERDRRVTVEAERESDRDDFVTDAHTAGIGEHRGVEVVTAHAEQCEVVARVAREESGLAWLGLTGEAHPDLGGPVDDVGVGEDLAVGGDDHSGPDRLSTRQVGADRDDRGRHVIDHLGDVEPSLDRSAGIGHVDRLVAGAARRLVEPIGDLTADEGTGQAGDPGDETDRNDQGDTASLGLPRRRGRRDSIDAGSRRRQRRHASCLPGGDPTGCVVRVVPTEFTPRRGGRTRPGIAQAQTASKVKGNRSPNATATPL